MPKVSIHDSDHPIFANVNVSIPKKTVVIGASPNPSRYSYLAVQRLSDAGHPVTAIGRQEGMIGNIPIVTQPEEGADVHTISLYISAAHQHGWLDNIISMQPKRVIFNPGTENPDFETLLAQAGILTERACTLVLLTTGSY